MKLTVSELNAFYGSSHVLYDVTLELNGGEVVALLGRNGAGKTTTFHAIMGLLRHVSGTVALDGTELLGRPPHEVSRLGVGLVPETRRIFADLTVLENLRVGVGRAGNGSRADWTLERVLDLFPVLRQRAKASGSALSGGEQQMLAIARTLLTNPEVLLLDEPFEGLAPKIVEQILEQLIEVRRTGVSILVSEQNPEIADELSDRAYVIEKGRIEHEGRSSDILRDAEIRRKYLAV